MSAFGSPCPGMAGDSHYVTGTLGGEGGRDTAVTPTDNGHPEPAVTREMVV